MRKAGIIANSALAAALLVGVGVGGYALIAPADADTAAVETGAPALTINQTGTDENGLAAEQEAEAAALVEAQRVAAEQAAAAEAARIAAEQAAAQAPAPEAETFEADEPSDGGSGPAPVVEPPVVTDWDPATKPCAVLEDGTPVPCQ